MSEYEDISVARSGATVRITVERPDRLNAYRDQTADELHQALREAEADDSIRVVVMTGSGRAFGAGYDLSTVKPDETPALDRVLEEHFNPLVRCMRTTRLPIIASVNGPCAGAAVGIALAADIVVAARSAYFYEPFANIALVPDAGNTLFVTRILGRARAAPMMFLGDRISAGEAASWGLIWKVVDDAGLGPEIDRIAAKLETLWPGSIASTKRLISYAADHGMDDHLDLERDLQGERGRTPEMKQAIADFFAKKR